MWLVFADAATSHTVVELLATKSAANICEAIDRYLVKMGELSSAAIFPLKFRGYLPS
jgi:hypothetical protein